ncbi:MAG: hypothetical protein IPL86_05770 [Flavobacteriales bacterium]|nr:hypothetical protein [Flavobacteriales bacterium]
MKANVVTRVFEAGGDASMDRTDVTYYPYTAYAGVKVPESNSYWGSYFTDTTYALGAVSLDADGKPLANHALDVQVVKVSYDWWWNGDMDGPSNYINAPSSRLIDQQHLTTDANGKANFNFRVDRPLWGRFIVRVSDPVSGHASAAQLYVDWPGYGGRSRREGSKDAAMLRFNSDKEKYAVGDECAITFPSSGKGRALVSIENGSRILSAQWVDLKEKETVFRFPITAEMAPNAFAHITLVQPHALTAPNAEGTANDLPIRMYGVIPIPVEDAATHITPEITAPPAIKTDEQFSVSVSEKDGKAMTYTLAIVDEGLLDLTRFKTPDPWNHFYAKEALGVRTWDVYDQVIGAFGQQLRRILALGGSDQASPADATKAQRFKPVVHFVGPFKLEKGKKATHQFTISNYVGSVRIMVVASTPQAAYGSAEKAVPVRKPLMLLATLPRVTGPGETVDLPVDVFAMEAKVKNAIGAGSKRPFHRNRLHNASVDLQHHRRTNRDVPGENERAHRRRKSDAHRYWRGREGNTVHRGGRAPSRFAGNRSYGNSAGGRTVVGSQPAGTWCRRHQQRLLGVEHVAAARSGPPPAIPHRLSARLLGTDHQQGVPATLPRRCDGDERCNGERNAR